MSKRGQAWATDIVVAMVIFIGSIMLMFAFIVPASDDSKGVLTGDGEVVANTISSDDKLLSFVTKGKIDQVKLERFANTDYSEIKRLMNVKGDFCIHFEDEEGNIIDLDGIQSVGDPGLEILLGSGQIISCGTGISVGFVTPATCGNGVCGGGETFLNCIGDCGSPITCNNGVCDRGETPINCLIDCPTPASCDGGTCTGSETLANCPSDCPAFLTCGNEICDAGENSISCLKDCPPPTCGDGICDAGETLVNCLIDC